MCIIHKNIYTYIRTCIHTYTYIHVYMIICMKKIHGIACIIYSTKMYIFLFHNKRVEEIKGLILDEIDKNEQFLGILIIKNTR